jgi:hypothetical protein
VLESVWNNGLIKRLWIEGKMVCVRTVRKPSMFQTAMGQSEKMMVRRGSFSSRQISPISFARVYPIVKSTLGLGFAVLAKDES